MTREKKSMWLVPILLLVAAGLGFGQGGFHVSSTAFKDGGLIPARYVMKDIGGENRSIPLSWINAPAGTKSFALTIVDPHPVANDWVHWMVVNIPADATALDEGASGKKMPAPSQELVNSYGEKGYGGPHPPKGTGKHPYVITIYALDTATVTVGAGPPLKAFQEAVRGKVLGEAKVTGYYFQ